MRKSQPNDKNEAKNKAKDGIRNSGEKRSISDMLTELILYFASLLSIQKKNPPSKVSASRMVMFASTLITLALTALIGRIFYIQHRNKDSYNEKILTDLYYDSIEIPFRRGDILDRDGNVLAKSKKRYRLILDPRQIFEPDKNGGNKTQRERERVEQNVRLTAKVIGEVFGVEPQEIMDLYYDNSSNSYILYRDDLEQSDIDNINKKVDEIKTRRAELKKEERLEEAKELEGSFIGYHVEDKYVREYPYNSLACDVIGFSDKDPSQGTSGIEQQYNSYLVGSNGREYGYLNDITALERNIIPPTNGQKIVSTIDINVQQIVERHIAQREAEIGSERTAVIVMDPNSGEILAMATSKGYDLNHPRDLSKFYSEEEIAAMNDTQTTDALSRIWKNYIVSDTFEPGSPAKVFTIGAAFEENVIDGTEHYYCNGFTEVQGVPISCAVREGHGELDTEMSLMKSCNVVMMDIAAKLGVDRFTKYQRIFGFGIKTGIDLPGEPSTANLVHDAQSMMPIDLATNSFGQNFNATMLQTAAAFCSAINGGTYYEPHVVKKIVDDNGSVKREIKPKIVRETISQNTSLFLRHAMLRTVLEGTGVAAAVPGYEVGGKTGTAETYPRKRGDYIVSFAGFAPVNNPQLVCYVVIDRPHVADQAHSTYASSLFSSIMQEVLPAMNIFSNPQNPEQDSLDAGLPAEEGLQTNTIGNRQAPVEEFIPQDDRSTPVSDILEETHDENSGLNIVETNAFGERIEQPTVEESIPQKPRKSESKNPMEDAKAVDKPTAADETLETVSPENVGR